MKRITPQTFEIDYDVSSYESLSVASLDRIGHVKLTPEQIEQSADMYNYFRDQNDGPEKIGLYGEDVVNALADPETVTIKYQLDSSRTVFMPFLVPAEKLEWYNLDLLQRIYGKGRDLRLFASPPLPQTVDSLNIVQNYIDKELENGMIIFCDEYQNQESLWTKVLDDARGEKYQIESLGGGNTQRKVDVFAAPFSITGQDSIHFAPTLYEVYKSLIEEGKLTRNPHDGVSLSEVITGSEAERLWNIYKNPFDELGHEHPTLAGFDKAGFMATLHDPAVMKIVNKVQGNVSTLCMFVQDFDHCPWFNKQYYQNHYSQYVDTDNVLMFPGIVSDESMRGNNYAFQVVDFATKLLAERGSNFLVTFECTEISTQYVPKIVESAVNSSGVASIEGLKSPISIIEYKSLAHRDLAKPV